MIEEKQDVNATYGPFADPERNIRFNRGLDRIAMSLLMERTEDIYNSVEAIRMGLIMLCLGGVAICIKRILYNG